MKERGVEVSYIGVSENGVITGITMVFIPAISTFEISALLGGNKENLIGNIIEQQFKVPYSLQNQNSNFLLL